jgi:uncharacterized protein YndB with AHSA1/START domain
VFKTLNGARHETLGVYREVEADRRLVFTFQWVSYPDRQSLVTVHFDAVPDGTELTVLHEDFHDELVQRSHRDGWDGSLTKLQALLETSPERNANADA